MVAVRTELLEANGLSFETDIAEGGEPLVLFLHGFPENKFSWRHQLAHLASQGYSAWAPNLRGYGRSSRPKRVRDYAIPRLLEDVAGLVDLARARGHERITLAGHDWGGVISWYFALRGVRPLDGLVVMNLPHPRRFVEGLRSLSQLRRSSYILLFQLPVLPEWLLTRRGARAIPRLIRETCRAPERFPDEVLERYRLPALEPSAMTAMLAYYRALGRSCALWREAFELGSLDVRTLMIWGEEDEFLLTELTRGTEELVTDLTLHRLPGVSHWVQQEASERVNAILTDWLRR